MDLPFALAPAAHVARIRGSIRTTPLSSSAHSRQRPDPFLISRYTFYLAQSYRDCGEKEKALANYMKRAELGFWNEEIYVSLPRGWKPHGGA